LKQTFSIIIQNAIRGYLHEPEYSKIGMVLAGLGVVGLIGCIFVYFNIGRKTERVGSHSHISVSSRLDSGVRFGYSKFK